jgi:hypothetical protein
MLRHVALIRTDVSEELSASFIRVTIGELGTTLAVTGNWHTLWGNTKSTASVVLSSLIIVTLMKEALSSSETSVLTRTTVRTIPEDDILLSHLHENLKSYILLKYSFTMRRSLRGISLVLYRYYSRNILNTFNSVWYISVILLPFSEGSGRTGKSYGYLIQDYAYTTLLIIPLMWDLMMSHHCGASVASYC